MGCSFFCKCGRLVSVEFETASESGRILRVVARHDGSGNTYHTWTDRDPWIIAKDIVGMIDAMMNQAMSSACGWITEDDDEYEGTAVFASWPRV